MAFLDLSPSLPKCLKTLAKEWAANSQHPASTVTPCSPSSLLTVTDQSGMLEKLPFKDLLQHLPMGLSAPAAQHARWNQKPDRCLVAGWLPHCDWGTLAATWGLSTAASHLQRSQCLQMFTWQDLAAAHLWQRQWPACGGRGFPLIQAIYAVHKYSSESGFALFFLSIYHMY